MAPAWLSRLERAILSLDEDLARGAKIPKITAFTTFFTDARSSLSQGIIMKLKPDHVHRAFSVIREMGISPNKPSTKWDIIDPVTAERFPPKAVLRVAKHLANDTSPTGGGGWPTNDPLIELGFDILLKRDLEVSIAPKARLDIADIFKSKLDETIKKRLVDARLGQGAFRKALLEIWNEKCAITDCNITVVLRASHIKPWRASNDHERLDPANGILLAASLDALFDEYLITFTTTGTIRANATLKRASLEKLGAITGRKISIRPRTEEYLVSHREEFNRISGSQSYNL